MWVAGGSIRRAFYPGSNLVDYYHINIKDAIGASPSCSR